MASTSDVAGQTVSDSVILTGRSWQMFATVFTVNFQKKYFIRTLFPTLEVPQRLQSERISSFQPPPQSHYHKEIP